MSPVSPAVMCSSDSQTSPSHPSYSASPSDRLTLTLTHGLFHNLTFERAQHLGIKGAMNDEDLNQIVEE